MADHKNWVAMKPKLRRAFAALKKAGIRAEMNFSISLSNGRAEIFDEKARGYAFYHSQDHNGARETGNVSILFGSFAKSKRNAAFIAIGNEVRDALVAEGLHVEWDGTAEARPTVYASTKVFEAQVQAAQSAVRDEATAEAEHQRIERAWVEAVIAAGVPDRLRAAAETIEGSFWISHEEYSKAEKKHNARMKKSKLVRIGLPLLDSPFIHPVGWVVATVHNAEAYKNKFAIRDTATALRDQGLVVSEIEDHKIWIDLNEWKPASSVSSVKTPKKVAAKSKPKSKAKQRR